MEAFFGWSMRILATLGVGFGFAATMLATKTRIKGIKTPGNGLIALIVTFWLIMLLLAILVIAETTLAVGNLVVVAVLTEITIWVTAVVYVTK